MPVAQLDYPSAKILMDITTPIEGQYRIGACRKEPWTIAFIESIPAGGCLWDIGANVGPYTLVGVARGLNVVAVEPGWANVAKLRTNLALNGWLDRALAFDCALGDHDGFTWLHYSDVTAGAASHIINDSARKITHHKQRVETRTLDSLVALVGHPGPHYLKIDVDGGELGVLDGAAALLPVVCGVLIEMRHDQTDEIAKRMTAAGLTFTAHHTERDGKRIPNISYGEFRRV